MSDRAKLQLDELATLVQRLQLMSYKTADKTDPAYTEIKSIANSLVDVMRSVKMETNG